MLHPPRLCIDSDALVNLLALGCLADALTCIGCTDSSSYRLPNTVAQLERAKWVGEHWPKADRVAMAGAARRLAVLPPPQDIAVQSALNSREGIDDGEAYILAKALEDRSLLVLTGDGRMIRALHQPPEVIDLQSLRGRVILFPQMIGALANRLSVAEVESRWRAAAPELAKHRQKSLSVMFGSASPTRAEDFWSGYELQISRVTDVCGAGWLHSL